jgi:hypothetical protein
MTDEARRDALPDLTGLRDAVALALRGSDPVRHRPTPDPITDRLRPLIGFGSTRLDRMEAGASARKLARVTVRWWRCRIYGEAPVLGEGTWVGLDVHARSVVGCAIDETAAEIRTQRIGAGTEQIVAWVLAQPGPVAACYEAGPTGFGLARALLAAGVRCEVVAPSKIERPAGDKVKTDRRDAERLARLLRIGELPGVRVPTQAEEAARDLVRAREDCRGDLMRARHRLSKLLLRQGLVWDQTAWTTAHEAWLRGHRFHRRGVQLAFDEALDTVFSVHARRDRLDAAITEMAATDPALVGPVGRLRCLRGGLDADRDRLVRRGRRLAALHRLNDRGLPRVGALGILLRGTTGPRRNHQDRQRARPAAAGRGRLAPPPTAAHQPGPRPTRRRATRCGPRPSRGREPAAAPALVPARGARQAPHDLRRRRRS